MAVFKGSSVRYYDSTNQKFVKIQGSQATGSDYTLQLPPNVGGADQVLKLPSAISDTNQLVWGDAGGDSSQTVSSLTLQGTTAATTSQAIYGVNLITTATTSALATRLPDASTGKQVTFVNTSTMSILVFPSVAGGKINGVVDGYASIPNDGTAYTFTCIENPLPGAWTWSPPAVNQIQLGRISVPHTQALPFGSNTEAWGVGVSGAQSNNPGACSPFYNCFDVEVGQGAVTGTVFTPGADYFLSLPQLTPKRTVTTTKIYSNALKSDVDSNFTGNAVANVCKYTYYQDATTGGGWSSSTAGCISLGANSVSLPQTVLGSEVSIGPSNTPTVVGDQDTCFIIQPMNTYQNPTFPEIERIGFDPTYGATYNIFEISIPWYMATKTYEFDIFIEHT